MYKSYYIFILLLLCVSVSAQSYAPNQTVGSCTGLSGTTILLTKIESGGHIPFFAYNRTVLYYGSTLISCITATQLSNDQNANVGITTGGVGDAYTTVNVLSGYDSKINYNITIYGSAACTP